MLWLNEIISFERKTASFANYWRQYKIIRNVCNDDSKNIPAGNYRFKVNNRNTGIRCEICSKLAIKTLERRQWRHSGVFIVNFEHISYLALVLLLLTLNR